MKKLLFILITMMTLVVFHTSAQTSATSFGINTFCQPLSKNGGGNIWGIPNSVFKKMQDVKADNAIYASLLKAGFTCMAKKNITEYDDGVNEYVTYLRAKYYKTVPSGKIFVEQDGSDVTVTFPNMTEKKKFLQTVKAEQAKGYIYSASEYYWVGVRIETSSNSFTVRVVANGAY